MDLDRYSTTDFGEARRTPGKHGYVAYFASPIPREVELPPRTVNLLAEAESALGGLAGIGDLLPNPDLLIRPYLLREAVASTRIEGTQATMAEVFESEAIGEGSNEDVEEVINYAAAMRWGLWQLVDLPISTRLLCDIHGHLMDGVRGRNLSPGELRTSQNWIGGATIESAAFAPPPPSELPDLLSDWERFAHESSEMPLLVRNALLHSQFETIHPFLDGNGRLGRLMLTFFLVARGRLSMPLLYLSTYLEQNRQSYYDALQTIHESGNPIPWIEMFLTAVQTQAADAVSRARRIVELRERYRLAAADVGTPNALALVELICESPLVNTRIVEGYLNVSRPTALRLLKKMEEKGVLTEDESGARGQRRYVAREMMDAVAGESG